MKPATPSELEKNSSFGRPTDTTYKPPNVAHLSLGSDSNANKGLGVKRSRGVPGGGIK